MNRLALLFTVLLCLPFAARADDASHRAKAKEMIEILHMEHIVSSLMDSAMKQTTAITTQRYGGQLPPDVQVSLADFQKKLAGVMEPQIGWSGVEPEFIKLYTDAFTEEQLDQMLAFYRSPTGRALVEKQPALNEAAVKLVQARAATLQPQVRDMVNDFEKGLTPPLQLQDLPKAPTAPKPPAASPFAPPSTTPTAPAPATSTPH
jgi:hypothetical protein